VFPRLASWSQPASEVWRRESGGTLQRWKSVEAASTSHWPFAWASVAAYQDAVDPKRKPLPTDVERPEPNAYLGCRGWVQWTTLPSIVARPDEADRVAGDAMRRVHLRAQVWANSATGQVIVAFAGTDAKDLQDWLANGRWLLRALRIRLQDQYVVLTNVFVPTFMAEFRRRTAEPGGAWLTQAQVIATGHSLGGGLAQRFAYSLVASPEVPGVKQVYGFDPSPVSGKRDVPGFENQANGLNVDRIYSRGEILASLRSLLHFGNPHDKRNQGQTWVDYRYRDDWSWKTLLPAGAVQAHGMYDLACFMKTHCEQVSD
jgi:hypothetical protein